MTRQLSLLLLAFVAAVVRGDSFSGYGCFSKSSILSYLLNDGEYIYQTSSYCQSQCSGKKVAALLGGKYCYCGLTVPLSSLEVDDDNCNTPCQGYGSQTCGGLDYFYVYVNGDVDGSSMQSLSSGSSSLSKSSSLSSQSTRSPSTSSLLSLSQSSLESSSGSSSLASSSSQSLSSSSSGSSSSSNGSQSGSSKGTVTTLVSTVTSSPSGSSSASVIEVTTTINTQSLTSSATGKLSGSSGKSLSGGGIAGVVIGTLVGVALIAGLIFFLIWRRRRNNDEDDEDFFDNGQGKEMGFDSVTPNPLMPRGGVGMAGAAGAGAAYHTHNNSNTTRSYSTNEDGFVMESNQNTYGQDDYLRPPNEEEYGRRRLSNGSLPDMANQTPLKVVNY